MGFKDILKMLDAFKVDATFTIPRINTKTGKNIYTQSFGSLPGFFFTLIAASSALLYIFPRINDMNLGKLDNYFTDTADQDSI